MEWRKSITDLVDEEVVFDGINHITTPEAVNGKYKIIEIDLDTNDIFTIVKDVK